MPHLYDVATSYFQKVGEQNPMLTVANCQTTTSADAITQTLLAQPQTSQEMSSVIFAQTEAAQQLVHRIVQHLTGVAESQPAPAVTLYPNSQPTPFVYQPIYQPPPMIDHQAAFSTFVGSSLGNPQNTFTDQVSGSAGLGAQPTPVYQPSTMSSYLDVLPVAPPPPPPPPPPTSGYHQVPNNSTVSYWMPLAWFCDFCCWVKQIQQMHAWSWALLYYTYIFRIWQLSDDLFRAWDTEVGQLVMHEGIAKLIFGHCKCLYYRVPMYRTS